MKVIAFMLIPFLCIAFPMLAEEDMFNDAMFRSINFKKDETYRIRLINGDIVTGLYKEKGESILREDSTMIESIIFTAMMGDITLYSDEIATISKIRETYRQQSSLYFMPTANAIGSDSYVSLTQLVFAQAGFGYENISINGGMTIIPGLSFEEQGKYLNVKYTFYEESQEIIPGHYTLAGGYSLIYANTANAIQHAYMVGSFHMPRTTLTTALFFKTGSENVYEASAGRWGSGIINYNDGALGFGLGFDIRLRSRQDTRVLAELWCADIMRPRNSAGFIGIRLSNDRYSMDAGLAMFTAPAIVPAVKFQWLPFN